MSKDDRELIERLSKALDFDAQAGTDAQWSRLMAEAMNARTRLEALQAQPVGEDKLLEIANRAVKENLNPDGTTKYRSAQGYACALSALRLAALTASPPVVEREAIADRSEIARIIDPHSFMDIPFTDDPVLLKMVEDSKGDALRKADAILALTPVEGVGGEWPDIGIHPMARDEPETLEAAQARLRAAYVKQQSHVPDQAALVWRADLMTVHHAMITMKARLDGDDTPVAQGDEVRDALDARQIAAINDTAVFLDACAGEELEVDGRSALALVEELQDAFLTDDQRDCFHLEVRKVLATLTKGARDAG